MSITRVSLQQKYVNIRTWTTYIVRSRSIYSFRCLFAVSSWIACIRHCYLFCSFISECDSHSPIHTFRFCVFSPILLWTQSRYSTKNVLIYFSLIFYGRATNEYLLPSADMLYLHWHLSYGRTQYQMICACIFERKFIRGIESFRVKLYSSTMKL